MENSEAKNMIMIIMNTILAIFFLIVAVISALSAIVLMRTGSTIFFNPDVLLNLRGSEDSFRGHYDGENVILIDKK